VVTIAGVLGWVIARSLTQPLKQLTEATRKVAAGDLDVAVQLNSTDEIGELAQSLNSMSRRLAEARDLRRQMTADIAHELRTPVSVILGYADGLQEQVIPPTEDTFKLIQEQAEQLEHLIEDLRILTRAEAGELSLDLSMQDPLPLLKRTLAAHEPQAASQSVTLIFQADDAIPQIRIDPDRFRQILSNLLANALQHTPEEGEISVSISTREHQISISIADTGPGIPEEELDRIFERFYRRDPSRSRTTGGSGLGLSIAKSLVERQEGHITVKSKPGEGATFTIEFPVPPQL
jgi:signal transduction histidine kinase